MHSTCDKTATYVARNGARFEHMVREREGSVSSRLLCSLLCPLCLLSHFLPAARAHTHVRKHGRGAATARTSLGPLRTPSPCSLLAACLLCLFVVSSCCVWV